MCFLIYSIFDLFLRGHTLQADIMISPRDSHRATGSCLLLPWQPGNRRSSSSQLSSSAIFSRWPSSSSTSSSFRLRSRLIDRFTTICLSQRPNVVSCLKSFSLAKASTKASPQHIFCFGNIAHDPKGHVQHSF